MNILIIGSTGGTGRELVQQALTHGRTVTAFARKPSDVPIVHERVRVGRGIVLDYDV